MRRERKNSGDHELSATPPAHAREKPCFPSPRREGGKYHGGAHAPRTISLSAGERGDRKAVGEGLLFCPIHRGWRIHCRVCMRPDLSPDDPGKRAFRASDASPKWNNLRDQQGWALKQKGPSAAYIQTDVCDPGRRLPARAPMVPAIHPKCGWAVEPQRGVITKPRPTAWVNGTQADTRALKGRNNRFQFHAHRGGGFFVVRCR